MILPASSEAGDFLLYKKLLRNVPIKYKFKKIKKAVDKPKTL